MFVWSGGLLGANVYMSEDGASWVPMNFYPYTGARRVTRMVADYPSKGLTGWKVGSI